MRRLIFDFRTHGRTEQYKHALREAWRFQLFHKFVASDRRDARGLRGPAQYSEAGCGLTRCLWEEADGDRRSVLVGAAHSPACYAAMRHLPCQRRCAACSTEVVPTWDHVAWMCEAHAQNRPQLPDDA